MSVIRGNTTSPNTGTQRKWAFLIDNLTNFNWDVNTPVSPMPLPEDTHESNILVKMEGNSAMAGVSWTLTEGQHFGYYDTVTKIFVADAADAAKDSVYAQINTFKNEFIPTLINDGYKLFVLDDVTNDILLEDAGTMNTIRFSVSGQSPVVWDANFQFMVGDVVSLFEADVPDRPTVATMEQLADVGGVHQIKVAWTPFTAYASSSDSVLITGVAVKYKPENGGTWTDFTDTGLIASQPSMGGGSESSTALASPDYRTFSFTQEGNYKFAVALLSNKSDEANVRLFKDAHELGEKTTDKTLNIT